MTDRAAYLISVHAFGDNWRASVRSDGLTHYAEGHSPAVALAELAHFWERLEKRSDTATLIGLVMDAHKDNKETK